MSEPTYGALMRHAAHRLSEKLGDDGTSQTEAALLLSHVSGLSRTGLIVREADPVPRDIVEAFNSALDQRETGKPVFRIIGAREFHGLTLQLSPETLEPRDDTECLVELVLVLLASRETPWRFADLGTGTGAIALALLSDLPKASCVASDVSQVALNTATENATAHGLTIRFETSHGSWFDALEERFDFLVSNPPYIASSIVNGLATEVRDHDPRVALDGGDDGLDAYRVLLDRGGDYLTKDGFLAVEIGHDQRDSVTCMAQAKGWEVLRHGQDLGGRDRAIAFRRRNAK